MSDTMSDAEKPTLKRRAIGAIGAILRAIAIAILGAFVLALLSVYDTL